MLVYNPNDGEIAAKNLSEIISVPQPPTTGNYILKSINGTIQWVLE
jgi:hypothetical protein